MKKSVLLQIVILILCILMATPVLSCSDGTQAEILSSTASTETEKAEETRVVANLPEIDFHGREFRIFGRENNTYPQFTNFEFYAESENGEVVNDAVLIRNRTIEEKYNVKIRQELLDDTTSHIRKRYPADDIYDICRSALTSPKHSSLAAGGYSLILTLLIT